MTDDPRRMPGPNRAVFLAAGAGVVLYFLSWFLNPFDNLDFELVASRVILMLALVSGGLLVRLLIREAKHVEPAPRLAKSEKLRIAILTPVILFVWFVGLHGMTGYYYYAASNGTAFVCGACWRQGAPARLFSRQGVEHRRFYCPLHPPPREVASIAGGFLTEPLNPFTLVFTVGFSLGPPILGWLLVMGLYRRRVRM